MNKPQITFDEYMDIQSKLEIRIGCVITAERIPKSKKLLKLTVAFGVSTSDNVKTIVTNLGENNEPSFFEGLHLPFIVNLVPSEIMGVESQGMIMVGESLDGTIDFSNHLMGTQLM
jgi:methionyl-tRNA synthetase